MRTGILFLVLQSLLLCAAVQAEPGATKSFQAEFAAAVQLAGKGTSADDPEGEEDPQKPADTATRPRGAAATQLFPIRHLPLPPGREGHRIRAPPVPA